MSNPAGGHSSARANLLFREMCDRIHRDTDRIFVFLMLIQWVGGIVLALTISPRTWIGATPYVHLHVFSSIFLGTLLSSLPIALALKFPGTILTRHVIAVAQVLWSALLIHLSGGRIETHFHVFGSLAFLAFYRDWRVLVIATVVVAGDHFVRGVLWPQSVFGVFVESPFRWLEHAAWVIFEDVFLIVSCRRGIKELLLIAQRQTALEETNDSVERLVQHRTAQLQSSNEQLANEMVDREKAEARVTRLGRMLDESLNEIYVFDACTLKFTEVNHGARENLGYTMRRLQELTPLDLSPDYTRELFEDALRPLRDGSSEVVSLESKHQRYDGTTYPIEMRIQLSNEDGEESFIAIIADITHRRRVESERDAAQNKLIEASRNAGMAEVATGILHNVGNVLNSVNVSANLVTDQLRSSRVSSVQRAADLLRQHDSDLADFLVSDERGRRFPGYLSKLSGSLVDEHTRLLAEVDSLNKNIRHVKEIVQMQQSYASLSGATETVSMEDLLEDALKVNMSGINHQDVRLVREFEDIPTLVTQKHKALQILINVISNAIKAMREVSERSLTLRLDEIAGIVRVEIVDTGIGIPAENLSRIFMHGFTTRKDGHGFGLHSSALAAKEIGGSLSVSSDGAGCGASFTLRIPCHADETPATAEPSATESVKSEIKSV